MTGARSAGVPNCAELASDPLVHRYEDMFNPPGLTNFLGAVQTDHDVVAVRSVNFPPYSHGDTVTGQLFLDGRLVRSYGAPVTVVWRPDRVTRTTTVDGVTVTATTACPPETTGVAVDIRLRNHAGSPRRVRLGLTLAATVTRSAGAWNSSHPPAEPNDCRPVAGRAAVLARARGSAAACVQGLDRPATSVGPQWLETEVDLPGGGEGRVGYLHLVGGDPAAALADFDRLAADIPGAVAAATALWEAEIAAAFTPGNGRWSGCLPVLRTGNAALRRLYYLGALGVMYMRRDTPASTLRRAYDTLMPRYWQTTTFIWDYMLSSCVHALLDPAPMRQQLALWMSLDIHTHFGTEWQHGSPVGYWYAVNDYAMTRLVREYVRCTGDTGFLDEQFAAASGVRKPVAGHVVDWARAWQGLRGAHGLADYGEMDNLLECVSSYTHEVASFNAANVWALRAAAEIADARSDPSLARRLRQEAAELFARVNALYVPGGWWRSGQPDGSLVPVKHCLDFANVALAAGEDLSPTQRAEMVAFFQRELRTASWLHALSPWDPDASYSRRPDHQWNGAYTAWPAEAALALYRLGRADLVADWLPGLARTANQGPFGQAHFTLDAAPGVAGGAAKAPPQPPYLTDWACSSSGAWVELVLCGVFGLAVPLVGEPTVTPRLSGIDPDATLSGLVLRGRRYAVSASGLRAED